MRVKATYKIILLFTWQFLFIANVTAYEKSLIKTYPEQQKIFVKAEKLLKNKDIVNFNKLYKQLDNYPLQPYLKMRQLRNTMEIASHDEIISFLEKHKGSPLDWPLRKAWLQYLVKKQQGELFLAAYNQTWNTELHCEKLKFLLKSGDKDAEFFSQVNTLWLAGKSLPKTCDPLLNAWQKAGYRTPELVWQRLALAADGGQHTLIPYLTGLLPKEQQYLGKLWHKVRRNPAVVLSSKNFKNKSVKEQQIYSYGIKRLIWRAPNEAIKSFEKEKKNLALSDKDQQKIIEKFALALASKKHPEARKWLHKVDSTNIDPTIMQWQITDVVKEQDWLVVLKELDSMPDSFKEELQWQYWYARALIATKNDKGQALMASVATKRHYYGFLAATHSNIPVTLQNNPLEIKQSEKKPLLNYPSAQRAFEFYALGRYAKARREWRYWLSQLNDRQKLIAAKVANENGWVDRAIFTLAKVGYLDDVNLRFPKAFDKKITQYASKRKINPAWAFAIARRESSFMPDARSSAGAKGLMQIMPATAKELKGSPVDTWYLYNAENNIELGTKYLRELLDKNKGNQVLATASYNAGPHRIRKWLKYGKNMPADVWIETIPFKETRNYVKSVLAYQEIYQHRPGQVSEVFKQLINMQIGN
jgi:soluble lytic murein transglycosylase